MDALGRCGGSRGAEPPALARVRARREVLECRACPLVSGCRRPVPWSGPAPSRVLVLGEAPGSQEDQAGEPFVGPSGRLLRKFLAEAGLRPSEFAWANTVACFPHRTPSAQEIQACRPNRLRALSAVSPEHVLLVGAVALGVYRSDLRISWVRGKPFAPHETDYWCFPINHPAAVLRDPSLANPLRRDLKVWRAFLLAPRPEVMVSTECASCGQPVDRYDPEGMPWCARHLTQGLRGYERSRRERGAPVAQRLGLFGGVAGGGAPCGRSA